jgi:hypothetical protein
MHYQTTQIGGATITVLVDPNAPPPGPVIPQILTMRQAKIVLHRHGMLDEVNNAVSRADEETRIEWEYATEVRRDWPTLAVMAAALNLDDKLLDALFIQGATL